MTYKSILRKQHEKEDSLLAMCKKLDIDMEDRETFYYTGSDGIKNPVKMYMTFGFPPTKKSNEWNENDKESYMHLMFAMLTSYKRVPASKSNCII